METTLGKRIAAGRKKLGMTQDQLAEKLGVTAQAVSKWENDQSCPDITMLPKLAEIFGTSTDALLGMETEKVMDAEVVSAGAEDENEFRYEDGKMEFHYDGGRRTSMGFAIWVLLTGVLKILHMILYPEAPVGIINIAWPTALLIFGLYGIYPRFSFLRFGCALFGGYTLIGANFYDLP